MKPVPITPHAGLKIAPTCEPVSADATLGRPFSCPGRGPQDHEQLLKNTLGTDSVIIRDHITIPDYSGGRTSCSGLAKHACPGLQPSQRQECGESWIIMPSSSYTQVYFPEYCRPIRTASARASIDSAVSSLGQ